MKIICVGRNYTEHIAELNNQQPDAPVIFLKPETAQIRAGEPFFYPDFSKDIHYEVELVVKINRVGKNIEERFAHKYYNEIAVGVDFTARDLQSELKAKGLPWDLAKAFNGSAPVSEFVPIDQLGDVQNLNFGLALNGEMKQEGNSSMMLYRINYLISFISKYFMIKKGDLIFTGTPKGVGPVQIGDKITTYLEGREMMNLNIK
ncbi:2-keto-4-pentenoate hydratase/2-oxohepta-3-ene-1,7-dioic acid hydratase in catechol pathway [Dyadobacter jejuensis]|uniref:2-keto-4-pentenoate hydratase/2-oxohepta-3-ene-1,7-dioic acid hydratase in catechol pathway n=1 Tax=Dyadobacter jejuensis TaxID=1082580 RepID=A0A316AAR7_9BACT|nr:fumarylacetoacetate hydrolase family protein [Dyadobacter jejuensis]PWJ54499.1 2-keto-4-pentenoate hydratase/2-oxohepta-3-ene-1,7-dioic acid hydratase in catechol pathway [Dyadobacter jejuensis]